MIKSLSGVQDSNHNIPKTKKNNVKVRPFKVVIPYLGKLGH